MLVEHIFYLDNTYRLCKLYVWSMRITIDLPENLLSKALKITKIRTKTELIKESLINLIQREKIKNIKNYRGKIDLDIDIDCLRN